MSTVNKMVNALLSDDNICLSVFDGEVWDVKKSRNKMDIVATINSVEECTIKVRTIDHNKVLGSFYCIFDDGFQIVDHTDNNYCSTIFSYLSL